MSSGAFRCLAFVFWAAAPALAQPDGLEPVPRFAIEPGALSIARPAQPAQPFTVAGEHGAILGDQSGAFEAWLWPVKILSRFGITAELADYPVRIELADCSAWIEVTPALTTITYSHAAFTVKHRMFAVRGGEAASGAVVFFEIASVRPLDLTFRFTPEMMRMWPAPNFGPANAEWVPRGESGYYVLHTNDSGVTAAVAMPRSRPGILAPYQERPRQYPVELKLHFDPQRDSGLFFPLLIVEGKGDRLAALDREIPALYARTAAYYRDFLVRQLSAQTPDRDFDDALRWAEAAIDQGRVRHRGETGLVAGLYSSGEAARPGFGWFFGRDSLWTSYAVNSYGDFALTRDVLGFLIRRQRADGKIMHEFSQTAELVDWKATPYFYAAADSTPLFVMAMEDYLLTSGDTGFLRANWEAVKRAYAFTRAHDSDGDGIYENTEGTGWVESWPGGMPHQEIYLAALDQQSADAMSRLAAMMNDDALAASARRQAALIRERIEAVYFDGGFYAFSRNPDGSLDRTATIYPAVAWWSGRFSLAKPEAMLARWASSEFSTDWGTRDISGSTPFYDPISYHQGSVWPLFTGWVSLAEYRAGRPLAGYAHLLENADLTFAQDPGAVTELLSGEFFQPLGRSSSHQVWSSAMVVTAAVRGLFGLDWDVPRRTLRVRPNLPAGWESARLRNVPFGESRLDIDYRREGDRLVVTTSSAKPEVLCLAAGSAPRDRDCTAAPAASRTLTLELPPVEIGIPHGLPPPGSVTSQIKILEERYSPNEAAFVIAGPGGSQYELPLRLHRAAIRVAGGELSGGKLRVSMPPGAGYQSAKVTFVFR